MSVHITLVIVKARNCLGCRPSDIQRCYETKLIAVRASRRTSLQSGTKSDILVLCGSDQFVNEFSTKDQCSVRPRYIESGSFHTDREAGGGAINRMPDSEVGKTPRRPSLVSIRSASLPYLQVVPGPVLTVNTKNQPTTQHLSR